MKIKHTIKQASKYRQKTKPLQNQRHKHKKHTINNTKYSRYIIKTPKTSLEKKTKIVKSKSVKNYTTQTAGYSWWVSKKVEIFYPKQALLGIYNVYASESHNNAPEIKESQILELPKFRFPHTKLSGSFLIVCKFTISTAINFMLQFNLGLSNIFGSKSKIFEIQKQNNDYIMDFLNKQRYNRKPVLLEYKVYDIGKHSTAITISEIKYILSRNRQVSNGYRQHHAAYNNRHSTDSNLVSTQYFNVKLKTN